MILAIDIGNSLLKWKLWDKHGAVIARDKATHADVLQSALSSYASCTDLRVVVSNVANNAIEHELIARFAGHQVQSIKATACHMGIVSAYQQPEKLGVDRWLAMMEAYHQADKKPVCVFDVGTAATLDVVDANGLHQGGFIVPGIQLMRSALFQSTSRVRADEIVAESLGYGINTNQAVEHGIASMMTAWIESELEKFFKAYPDGIGFITGGDAHYLSAHLTVNPINIYEDLVLDGLCRFATS